MKRFIFILMVCLSLVLVLGGCHKEPDSNNPSTPTGTESTEPSTESSTQPTGQDPTEETQPQSPGELEVVVKDAFANSVIFQGNTMNYAIPCVEIDGQPLESVNAEIWATLHDGLYLPMVEKSLEENGEISLVGLRYEWYQSNGILTVYCVQSDYYTDYEGHHIFNILLAEQRLASQEELLNAFGITEGDFYAQVSDLLGSKFWDDNKARREEIEDQDLLDVMDGLLGMTVDPSNVMSTIAYVGPQGELYLDANIFSLAGAGFYQASIPYSYPISQEYLEYARSAQPIS